MGHRTFLTHFVALAVVVIGFFGLCKCQPFGCMLRPCTPDQGPVSRSFRYNCRAGLAVLITIPDGSVKRFENCAVKLSAKEAK